MILKDLVCHERLSARRRTSDDENNLVTTDVFDELADSLYHVVVAEAFALMSQVGLVPTKRV